VEKLKGKTLQTCMGVKVEGEKGGKRGHGLLVTARIFLIFNLVSFLWLLFQLPDIRHVGSYFKEVAAFRSGNSPQIMFAVLFFGFPVIIYHIWGMIRLYYWEEFSVKTPRLAALFNNGVYAILLFLIIVNSGSSGSFLYFQF
jgi:alginate O-acetyltransferase complex protein AlgI